LQRLGQFLRSFRRGVLGASSVVGEGQDGRHRGEGQKEGTHVVAPCTGEGRARVSWRAGCPPHGSSFSSRSTTACRWLCSSAVTDSFLPAPAIRSYSPRPTPHTPAPPPLPLPSTRF